MTFTQKESTLLKDLKAQEQLCVQKYGSYANEACDSNLKNLFNSIQQVEQGHLNSLNQLIGGQMPQTGQSGGQKPTWNGQCSTSCSVDQRRRDYYLVSDALATEKHASSLYDTCIFEFNDTNVRDLLNHIQKEEQQHGEQLNGYKSQCSQQLVMQ